MDVYLPHDWKGKKQGKHHHKLMQNKTPGVGEVIRLYNSRYKMIVRQSIDGLVLPRGWAFPHSDIKSLDNLLWHFPLPTS